MNRRRIVSLIALALVATFGGFARPPITQAATSPFTDIDGTTFEADIDWLWAEGITVGCSDTKYCPNDTVTRGQMATFLVRMFDLTEGAAIDAFADDDGTTHEQDINRLAHAGLTKGCTPTAFCPANAIRRDEMATFLARAIPLVDGAGNDYFRDDDGTTHEANVDRAAAAGIASGCYPSFYCPARSVTRGEMAGFLHRVETPITPPSYPAPKGPLTLFVGIDGQDAGNDCFDEADPCATIRHALELALDGDAIEIGPGTFLEEGLYIGDDVTVSGDPDGGTVIDASGGERVRVISVGWERTVAISHVTLTGGIGHGGAIYGEHATIVVEDSTITGNKADDCGGGINAWQGDLTIRRTTVSDNASGFRGGGICGAYGIVSIEASTIVGNTTREGGGVYQSRGTLRVSNSTFMDNTATALGGAIRSFDAFGSVVNTTISGNQAGQQGGGLSVRQELSTFYLRNAIVAGNQAPSGAQLAGTITSQLASIIGVPAGLTLADILDPAGLQDNGGPTKTIALTDSATNPALDHGDAGTCAAAPVSGIDQRGEPRTPPCDIGAYEVQP